MLVKTGDQSCAEETGVPPAIGRNAQFGLTNPVLVDEQSILIAGHGRLRAAREIGLAEVPTIELAGLTEAQKKALRLPLEICSKA